MAFQPFAGERDPIVEIMGHRQAQRFYRLEEAAERVSSRGRTNGHYAGSPHENDILQRYVEILDMIGMAEQWDDREQRYKMMNTATAASIGILLSDFARSEARGIPLTPSASLLGPIYGRTSQQDRVRLIPTPFFRSRDINSYRSLHQCAKWVERLGKDGRTGFCQRCRK